MPDRIEELETKLVMAVNEEAFMDEVWSALKTDTSDLRKQQRILKAFRTTIAAVSETHKLKGEDRG